MHAEYQTDEIYIGVQKDGEKDSEKTLVEEYPGYYVGDRKQYLS